MASELTIRGKVGGQNSPSESMWSTSGVLVEETTPLMFISTTYTFACFTIFQVGFPRRTNFYLLFYLLASYAALLLLQAGVEVTSNDVAWSGHL